jgi:hypothetical protein
VRARGRMPGMSRPGAPGRAEPALVAAPGRDAAITAVVVALTACAFAAAGVHGTLASIHRLDDAWLRLMISGRVTPLTAIAKVFNVVADTLADNLPHPMAPIFYSVSTLHCLTVSLAHGGAGIGSAFGEQMARRMLAEAGLGETEVHPAPGHSFDAVYVTRTAR